MKLTAFYKQAIRAGRQADPRRSKKKIFSYSDSAILNRSGDREIRKILVGIDIEASELLLADRLRERRGLDLVISHHPEGRAYVLLPEVMRVQVDILEQAGIERGAAEKFLEKRMEEVGRKLLAQNHMRPVDVANLLGLPFICIHTPADNHAYSYLKNLMTRQRPKDLKGILDRLMEIPEYKHAAKNSLGPRILLGHPKRSTGKILLEMTGGTEGPNDIFDKIYKAGVRTLVCMHLSEEHFKKVRDANLNVIIAGHISSDTLGLNLLLDKVERFAGYKFEVIDCSGFRRVQRNG